MSRIGTSRSIVVCLDHAFDVTVDATPVGQLYACLLKGDIRQTLLYTDFARHIEASKCRAVPPFMRRSESRLLQEAYKKKVFEVYLFIAKHYSREAKVSIFTVGDGAHIACAVLGMIQQIGILVGSARNIALYDTVYKAYVDSLTISSFKAESTRRTNSGLKCKYKPEVNRIKSKYSRNAIVEFLGIWDAEEAKFCNMLSPSFPVRTFRHALSLRSFRHALSLRSSSSTEVEPIQPRLKIAETSDHSAQSLITAGKSLSPGFLEVWFDGNKSDNSGDLAKVSLRWMIKECTTRDSGVLFEERKEKNYTDLKKTEDVQALLRKEIFPPEISPMVISKALELIKSREGVPRWLRFPFRNKAKIKKDAEYLFKELLRFVDELGERPGGTLWMNEPILRDAIWASTKGGSAIKELSDESQLVNIHWTVKKRFEFIDSLNKSPGLRTITQQWLGNIINLPENVNWIA